MCNQSQGFYGSNNTLSPAAQAVLDAYSAIQWQPGEGHHVQRIAAILRAAADLVAPDNYHCFTGHFDWDLGMEARNDTVRENLLAIAAELEGQS